MAHVTTHRIYYDGTVHVQHHMCATCIGKPGNLMHLEPGRRDGMVADVLRDESRIPCHKTLDLPAQAVCRWQFDQHPTQPLQVAQRLRLVTFMDPTTNTPWEDPHGTN